MARKSIFVFVVLIGIVFLCGCTLLKKNLPEKNQEFQIKGLYWRTYSYYSPGIYEQGYNYKSNVEFISKAKNVGANYLLVRAFYNGTDDGGLIGNDEEAQKALKEAIAMAHDAGLKVFLTPYVESREYWINNAWKLNESIWEEKVLFWAKFAEENDVEMFTPGVEMILIFGENRTGPWLKEILPKIREVYKGKIVTAEHLHSGLWKKLDEQNVFAGYDCIGITMFPWLDYKNQTFGGDIDIRSFEDYEKDVEEKSAIVNNLAGKYGINCTLAAPLGMDFWHGEEPNASIEAKAYDLGLDVLNKYNFTGVFLHHWASEEDHFGESKQVENIIKSRWAKS